MKTLTTTLLSLFAFALFGQQTVEISGQVKDAETKKALEYCSVSFFNKKDSLIGGTITDQKGFFSMPIVQGYYNMVLHFVGYKTDTIAVTAKGGFMGVYKIMPSSQTLAEHIVTESSRMNLLDKDVTIVTDQMRQGSTDTKDVLEKVEGITYDPYNSNLKVDNDKNIVVLVDGIKKDQEYIQSLSPERLQKVELVRSPGGRYGLEGYTAIVNVILKKDYQGAELFLMEKPIFHPNPPKGGGLLPKNDFNGTWNYTYNKVNLYAKCTNNFIDVDFISRSKKEYSDGLAIEKNQQDPDQPNLVMKKWSNHAVVGADYYINPKQTLSWESYLMTAPAKGNVLQADYGMLFSENGNLTNTIYTSSSNISNEINAYHSVLYSYKLSEKSKLELDALYGNNTKDYTNIYHELGLQQREENGLNKGHYAKVYAEFSSKVTDKSSLQAGYGNTYKTNRNTFDVTTLTMGDGSKSQQQSEFGFSDMRHRLYGYYSFNQSNKLGIKMGMAGETSAQNVNGNKNNYLLLLPYANVRYAPAKVLNFTVKYRTQNIYPAMNQTNPFTMFFDQQAVITGNPNLRPATVHGVSVRTNVLNGLFSIEPYYRFSNNYIAQNGMLLENNVFEYTFSNTGKYDSKGVLASLTVPFSKHLMWQTEVHFYSSKIVDAGRTNSISDWSADSKFLYMSQKKGLMTGLQYINSMSKHITAQGYDEWDNDLVGLFVKKTFAKQRASAMLFYVLPTNFGVDFVEDDYIETQNYKEQVSLDMNMIKNIFLMEFSYRISKGSAVKKTRKDIRKESTNQSKGLI